MGSKKSSRRKGDKTAPLTAAPPPSAEILEDAETTEYVVDVNPREDRVAVRLMTNRYGELIDFSIQQEIRLDGQWRPVVRYDCAHGEVHVHRFRRSRRAPTLVKRVADLGDIEAGYDEADRGIFDRWEENRRSFLEGVRRGKRAG